MDTPVNNADVLMEELRKWFAEQPPNVKTRIIKPRESWGDHQAMHAKVVAAGHAAIMGVALALKESEIPTILVSTHVFASLAKAGGMPTLRNGYVPKPVVGLSSRELRAYIDRHDPVHKLTFIKGVLNDLTEALSDEDLKALSYERQTPRLLEPDTEDGLRMFFLEQHWTDQLSQDVGL
jgi:hypothetical protein